MSRTEDTVGWRHPRHSEARPAQLFKDADDNP
jgi:hypothetical protein